MIEVQVKGAGPKENKLVVGDHGEIFATVHAHPPKTEGHQMRPFVEFFANLAGATDMRVDGSTTNVTFAIDADPNYDTYIKSAAVVIADASAALNKFGNLAELTNGVSFSWETNDIGNVVIAPSLKNNFDFVQLSGGYPAFGDGTAAFRATNVKNASEAYIPIIRFDDIFGLQWGIKLRKGTKDRLCWVVKDDVTGVDRFDITAYGAKI